MTGAATAWGGDVGRGGTVGLGGRAGAALRVLEAKGLGGGEREPWPRACLARTARKSRGRRGSQPSVSRCGWRGDRCASLLETSNFFQNGLNLSLVRKWAFADWAADLLLETVVRQACM
jgi:hypothetical protein